MNTAKAKIRKCVEDYIRDNAEEWTVFKAMMEQNRAALADETFGEAQGTSVRALFEMPVTLHESIVTSLDEEELSWFKAGGSDRKQGGRWFAKTFPVFALPSKI